MASQTNSSNGGPKSKPNYFYAIGSVAMVLFVLGLFGMFILQSRQLVDYFKEKINVMIELKDATDSEQIEQLQAQLQKAPYLKAGSMKYISKEDALDLLREDFGEEFMKLNLPNPLHDILLFNVNSDYMRTDSLDLIRSVWRLEPTVSDVYYQEQVVDLLENNLRRISWMALGFGVFFLFIAFVLIHNTIRLALYANRMLIKNMELAGASWAFISRPFIWKSVRLGAWSSIIAIAMLTAILFWLQEKFPDLRELQDWSLISILFGGLLLFGIAINIGSTYFTVNKYLKMRIDEVY
ncbi:MAG: permease-like cell division protein FtsX [Saprospiraceae bacterium]|nr:permease-like cell division protein FtsX [Saprospiraceae bacterium]